MSSSFSNDPPVDTGDFYGCLLPRSNQVSPITFGRESDRTMWTLGRGEFNAAVLPSPAISLHHATVTCIPDKGIVFMYIEDFSTNGIWIDGKRIAKDNLTLLKDGCDINFGQLHEHHDQTRDFRFTFRQLKSVPPLRFPELDKEYEVCQVIGTGSICRVLLGVERATNERVAIKLYNRAKKERKEAMERERLLLQYLLEHDNICRYKLASVDDSEGTNDYLVFEYVDGMNLRAFMSENRNVPIDEDMAKHIVLQICKAVQHLQDPNKRIPGAPRAIMGSVAHADLKPENILLDSESPPTVKLCDFNAVIFAGEQLHNVRGAEGYMAPEMAHPQTVDYYIDNYSVGILAFELLTGNLPYDNQTPAPATAEGRIASRVMKDLNASLQERSPAALDFIKKLLEPRTGKRMSMNEALEHPWLAGAGRSARSKGKQRAAPVDEDDVDMRPASPVKASVRIDIEDLDADIDMRPASPIKRGVPSPVKPTGVRFLNTGDAAPEVAHELPAPAALRPKTRASGRVLMEKPPSRRVTRSMGAATQE